MPDESATPVPPDETPDPAPVANEADERFPSGPWTGFFLQPSLGPGRFWMELILTFRQGTLTGEGRDKVGPFLIRGRYDVGDGKCWWSKRYLNNHDVAYKGYNEGRGIWGTWELSLPPDRWHGGFHIWPVGMADPTAAHQTAEAKAPEAEPELAAPFVEPTLLPETETVGAGEGTEVPA